MPTGLMNRRFIRWITWKDVRTGLQVALLAVVARYRKQQLNDGMKPDTIRVQAFA
jgi:hypothetical protein